MRAYHADSLHHRGLMWRDRSCQNTGAAVSSSKDQMGEKKVQEDTHSHLAGSVRPQCVDGLMNARKDKGNPELYLTHTQKKKSDFHQSITGSVQTGEPPVEMTASEQCHPCHHNRRVAFLSSTGKHIHMMRLAEQRSLISHCGLNIFNGYNSQWLTMSSKFTHGIESFFQKYDV